MTDRDGITEGRAALKAYAISGVVNLGQWARANLGALLDELEDLRGDRNARLVINLQAAEYRVRQLKMAYDQQDLILDAGRQRITELDRQYQNALTEIGDKGARIIELKAALAGLRADLEAKRTQHAETLGHLKHAYDVIKDATNRLRRIPKGTR